MFSYFLLLAAAGLFHLASVMFNSGDTMIVAYQAPVLSRLSNDTDIAMPFFE